MQQSHQVFHSQLVMHQCAACLHAAVVEAYEVLANCIVTCRSSEAASSGGWWHKTAAFANRHKRLLLVGAAGAIGAGLLFRK